MSNIIPWEISTFPKEIQSELERRKNNFGYRQNVNSTDWSDFRGPMTSWARIVSNGKGRKATDGSYPNRGFVMSKNFNFYDTFGLNQSKLGIIGQKHNGSPHVISYDINTTTDSQIHVPPPNVTLINTTIQKELFRRVIIQWECYSAKQLEYMTPYFLTPGITVLVEFGWDKFDTTSLLPIEADIPYLKNIYKDSKAIQDLYSKNILRSKGNYDVIFGVVTNFTWASEGNKFVCTTEVTSKDRLYAGLSKDVTVFSNVNLDSGQVPTISSFRSFINNDSLIDNMKTLVRRGIDFQRRNTDNPSINELLDIISNRLSADGEDSYINKLPYVYGVFWGRDSSQGESIKANKYDFDVEQSDSPGKRIWINLGLLFEFINYFTNQLSLNGAKNFTIDIDDVLINGHPNMISTNNNVLIPNKTAPKFFWGDAGLQQVVGKESFYETQIVDSSSPGKKKYAKVDDVLIRTFYQKSTGPARDDIDQYINYYRYKNMGKSVLYCFPEISLSTNNQQKVHNPNYMGYLKNIYFSLQRFKDIINDPQISTFQDIVQQMLTDVGDSVSDFVNLAIVQKGESENTLTIVDRNFPGGQNFSDGEPVHVFSLFDSNSIIKSFSFKPALTMAQATRTIVGERNNSDSSTYVKDANDILNYEFRDEILYEQTGVDDGNNVRQSNSFKKELFEKLKVHQRVDNDTESTLQMTFKNADGSLKYVKLIMPDVEFLKIILDDNDFDNNPKYIGIQPGINAELVIDGIGGLRTFQCFLIKNLPEPYTPKNIIFRITDVVHTLQNKMWETKIVAGIIPFRGYFRRIIKLPTGL